MTGRRAPRGQAAVELVALLPAVVLAALVVAQIVLAGSLWTLAGGAARAGARAAEVGAPAEAAARAALPGRHAGGARVQAVTAAGAPARVRVRLPVPRLLPLVPRFHVSASATAAGGGGP
ncbi:hypothetical protein [Miltoncostaea marina]|uniref:hypothetical protein n=1 Tax=Miltoncostaea marina TaxID=2843215 RepID=UPI001C3CEB77|nr:hypothetical protein [Miltoncostaea marina]